MQMQQHLRGTGGAQNRPLEAKGRQTRNDPSYQTRTIASAILSPKPLARRKSPLEAYNEPSAMVLRGAKPPSKRFVRPILPPRPFESHPRRPSCPMGSIVAPTTESERRIIQIGIEAEFELAASVPEYSLDELTLKGFVKTIAQNYNKQVPECHPQMLEGIRPSGFQGPYDEWCLVLDPTVTASQKSFVGLELVSPILTAVPGSRWRDDVEVVWKYLLTNYRVVADPRTCSTHIHVSLEPFFSTVELKRIAQAVIHFEPAFEALMGFIRRGNTFAKSNWLDSPSLREKDKSRSQLMADIEREVDDHKMVRLMQDRGDRNYFWNFWSLFNHKRTIEFRKPPPSTAADDAILWAELAMSFIQASVGYESLQQLQRVPATVGGLRWFIAKFTVAGVNDPNRLQLLWASSDPNAALQPIPCRPKGIYTWQEEALQKALARLQKLAGADQRQSQKYAKTAQEPYW